MQQWTPGTSFLQLPGTHFLGSTPEFPPGPQSKGSNDSSLATTLPKAESLDSSTPALRTKEQFPVVS